MDKIIITLLVVIGVLVLFLGIALEEIKALQQDKRDWKNRYYAAAQIRSRGGVGEKCNQYVTMIAFTARMRTASMMK